MNPTLKKYLIICGVGLALLLVAFATGRYTVPTKVVEKVVTVEKVVEKVDEKKLEELTEQIKQTLTQIAQLKKSIHKEKTTNTFPDGRIEAKETVDINVEKTVTNTEVKEVVKEVVVVQEKLVDRIVEKEVVKEKIVEAQKPQWKVGALLGANIKEIGVAQGVFSGPFAYGAIVERRIAGPVFAGLWGMNSGQVGAVVAVEF